MSMRASRRIGVFGASDTQQGSELWRDARDLGGLIARSGYGLVSGGYGGTMEAVSQGAREAGGGDIVGVTAPKVFPGRKGPNPFITREIAADSLFERMAILTEMSDAFIVLPGAIGTLAELTIAWNLSYVAPLSGRRAKPVVAVGERWRRIVAVLDSELGQADRHVALADDAAAAFKVVRERLTGW